MSRTKVLIVDDDVTSRTLLRRVLEQDDIEIVAVASNGPRALECVESLQPDVVILDIDMPGVNSLDVLEEVGQRWPDVAVIVSSGHTAEGAGRTLEALSLGAVDYVTKPQGDDGDVLSMDRLGAEILPRVRNVGRGSRHEPKLKSAIPTPSPTRTSHVHPCTREAEVVVIGISTGGPNALVEFIPRLDAKLPVPVLIVQHMPPAFTKTLAKRLDSLSSIDVSEAMDGEGLHAGHVYIAPGGSHMEVAPGEERPTIRLHGGPPVNSCRPAADPLFESAVSVYGDRVLALVMTGMGFDGLEGCAKVKQSGGQVLTQTEDTCVVWGMPRAVVEAGLSDGEIPLHQFSAELSARVQDQAHQVPKGPQVA